jgi:selenocysteine lyase/cysteine desulfurase
VSFDEDLFSKRYFPTLKNNPELLYFDSAATTHTHKWVVDRMDKFYREERCTVHRGDGKLSKKIEEELELSRSRVAHLIGANPEQLLFTRGATDSLNMVANWNSRVKTIIVTEAEHNSNIIPWLAQGRSIGNGLELLPLEYHTNSMPTIDMNRAMSILNKHAGNALLSICTHSNVTGTPIAYTPYNDILKEAKSLGIITCVDACQTVGHLPFDVNLNHADWAVFSAHKMYGPMGIGALYYRNGVDLLRPLSFGGGQADHVSLNNIVMRLGHAKHEVGTPDIPAILGFGIAAELINYVGYNYLVKKEINLSNALKQSELFDPQFTNDLNCIAFNTYPTIYGNFSVPGCQNIYSFVTNSNASDISALLSERDVIVRSGKMCAHMFADQFSTNGLLRISLAPYNTTEECFKLVPILNEVLASFN